MVEQVSDSKDVCNFQVNTLFKVPGVWKFSDAHLICKALVGNANVISSSENQNKIISMIKDDPECSKFHYLIDSTGILSKK